MKPKMKIIIVNLILIIGLGVFIWFMIYLHYESPDVLANYESLQISNASGNFTGTIYDSNYNINYSNLRIKRPFIQFEINCSKDVGVLLIYDNKTVESNLYNFCKVLDK
jgi:hypothetical protein